MQENVKSSYVELYLFRYKGPMGNCGLHIFLKEHPEFFTRKLDSDLPLKKNAAQH